MFNNKPVICVIPLYDEKRNSFWMLPGYLSGLEEQGAIPVMPSFNAGGDALDYFLDTCDGFLLTGGQDINPSLYGQIKFPRCGFISRQRDNLDQYILSKAVDLDKPVLGICRGCQFINAFFGGTLYQDLPSEKPSNIEHRMRPPYDKPAHNIDIMPATPLAELIGAKTMAVNSCHHQAVKKLSPRLKIMAIAPDGIIEAVYMPDRSFIWGIQWHPECTHANDANSKKIFASFAQAAMKLGA